MGLADGGCSTQTQVRNEAEIPDEHCQKLLSGSASRLQQVQKRAMLRTEAAQENISVVELFQLFLIALFTANSSKSALLLLGVMEQVTL